MGIAKPLLWIFVFEMTNVWKKKNSDSLFIEYIKSTATLLISYVSMLFLSYLIDLPF